MIAFYEAVQDTDLDRVRELVLMVADMEVNISGGLTSPLLAASDGYWIIVDALLEMAADARASNDVVMTALDYAVVSHHRETVVSGMAKDVDIEAGCERNNQGKNGSVRAIENTALIVVAQFGWCDSAKALVQHGANVDARNRQHCTTR